MASTCNCIIIDTLRVLKDSHISTELFLSKRNDVFYMEPFLLSVL